MPLLKKLKGSPTCDACGGHLFPQDSVWGRHLRCPPPPLRPRLTTMVLNLRAKIGNR